MDAVVTPRFDVPFLCANCQKEYGHTPQTGMFPKASICEISYKNSTVTWRLFACCDEQTAVCRRMFSGPAEEFDIVWKADPEPPRLIH